MASITYIDADAEGTWPEVLLKALSDHAGQITAYHVERARIDRAAEKDIMLFINRPGNPHQHAWDAILKMSENAVAGQRILGFHATRLTSAERENIRLNGLCTLSPALIERRLEGIDSAGLLSGELLASLRARNQVHDRYRIGMTWFCFNRALLRDESGVERLLRSWGGEALYNSHEHDEETGPVLRSLGQPCIVVAAVPAEGIKTFLAVGQRLVNIWCAKQGINTEHAPGFEGHVRTNISGNHILKIVSIDDPEFLRLTAHDSWRKPLC